LSVPCPKEEIFFIDDLKTNVESACLEGIDAIQYSDFAGLLKECQTRHLL